MALSAMQGKLEDVTKSKQGYGYKYADLGSVLEEVRPLLAYNKLAISQLCSNTSYEYDCIEDTPPQTEHVCVETVLMHESGQWISSKLIMPVTPMKGMTQAQAMGSVISYARRYMLASILGLTQVDNDAANVSVHMEEQHKQQPPKIAPQPAGRAMLASLERLIDDAKVESTEINKWVEKAKVKSLSDLDNIQMQAIINLLVKRLEPKKEVTNAV